MTFWNFFRSHAQISVNRVLAFAAISGLANAALLAIINSAAHDVSQGDVTLRMFLMFLAAITLYIVTQRYILRVSSQEVERIVAGIRIRMSDRIRQADLHSIEGVGRTRLYAAVNSDTATISQATAPLIMACQGAILVVFSLVYILVLSPMAFRLTVLLVAIGVSIHFRNRKELMGELQRASAAENTFFEGLTHLLDGFKEVKLNTRRSDDLYAHLRDTAHQVATLKTATGQRYADYFIFTQVVFYVLLGTMVFVLPTVSEVYSEQVTRIAAAILFIIGPLTLTVSLIPVLRAANHAVTNITALEAELEAAGELARQKEGGLAQAPETFSTIQARDLVFIYRDRSGEASFTLGPIDLAIHSNETLLIVGGNGSGKSTMLKLLTALYYPTSGTITLDGVDIKTLGYRAYRELFAAIYSDYHLFDRLYGLPNIDDTRVIDLLHLMQLEKKTRWRDGRFENQDLSTGQKKRLALVISLLEDKQIYVFDEWAADQDPGFRQFFYETLLPDLKARGKTLIVATHDDRYFSVGDRVVKMELGRIVSDTRNT